MTNLLAAITMTVTVGVPYGPHGEFLTITNCVQVTNHAPSCVLVVSVKDGKTNEFHAWAVPVRVETNKPPS